MILKEEVKEQPCSLAPDTIELPKDNRRILKFKKMFIKKRVKIIIMQVFQILQEIRTIPKEINKINYRNKRSRKLQTVEALTSTSIKLEQK